MAVAQIALRSTTPLSHESHAIHNLPGPRTGIEISIWGWKTSPHQFLRKPRKPEKPIGFWYKIEFSKFEGKTKNRSGFPVYQSVFMVFDFHFFGIFKNFKSTRPVFGETTKPAWTGFVGFHENRPVFVDIVIHGHKSSPTIEPTSAMFRRQGGFGFGLSP
jgi:hypothetical protein